MIRGGSNKVVKTSLAASQSNVSPHHVDNHPPERLPLLLGEILEDVAVVFLQQFEAHGQVVVLQH